MAVMVMVISFAVMLLLTAPVAFAIGGIRQPSAC